MRFVRIWPFLWMPTVGFFLGRLSGYSDVGVLNVILLGFAFALGTCFEDKGDNR